MTNDVKKFFFKNLRKKNNRVQVCLRFAVDVGSSGVCMFHVLILMSTVSLSLTDDKLCLYFLPSLCHPTCLLDVLVESVFWDRLKRLKLK